MKTLGKLVRERRELAGYMNQRDFADAIERAQSWVSRVEADRMMNAPSPEELKAISNAILGRHMYQYADETGPNSPVSLFKCGLMCGLAEILALHRWWC